MLYLQDCYLLVNMFKERNSGIVVWYKTVYNSLRLTLCKKKIELSAIIL